MDSRRTFLSRTVGITGLLGFGAHTLGARVRLVSDALLELGKLDISEAVQNDELWKRVQQAYTVSANIINLNNGGVSPQPKVVQDAVDRYYHLSNEAPSYYMWRILDQGREGVRSKLAELTGTSPDEVAVNRNATEALDTVIFGLRLKKGDEVVLTKQDYPNMINAWKQRAQRDGIVLKWVDLPMPFESDDIPLKAFRDATTSKTRVYHITHMINWNGQIMPAAKLCSLAAEKGIISLVDGAHTFAHLDFKVAELGCDYFGTSLHKWLCAPFGTGMLYAKKERIAETWPLIPHHEPESDDIRKFEALGTRSFAPEQAIGQAINFHLSIGSQLKEQRLRYLKNYWCNKVIEHPKISIGTYLKDEYSCALAVVNVEGLEPGEVSNQLFRDHKIHTTSIIWENIRGARITPHVYTMEYDLDRLIKGLYSIADKA